MIAKIVLSNGKVLSISGENVNELYKYFNQGTKSMPQLGWVFDGKNAINFNYVMSVTFEKGD